MGRTQHPTAHHGSLPNRKMPEREIESSQVPGERPTDAQKRRSAFR